MSGSLIKRKQFRRLLRYVIMFLTIVLAAKYTTIAEVTDRDTFVLATIAAIAFAVLDMLCPIVVV